MKSDIAIVQSDADALRRSLSGLVVTIRIPPTVGTDWNDELQRKGTAMTADRHRTAVGARRKAVERAALDLICDVIDTDLPTDAILARFGRAIEPHLPADVIQRHRDWRQRRAQHE